MKILFIVLSFFSSDSIPELYATGHNCRFDGLPLSAIEDKKIEYGVIYYRQSCSYNHKWWIKYGYAGIEKGKCIVCGSFNYWSGWAINVQGNSFKIITCPSNHYTVSEIE